MPVATVTFCGGQHDTTACIVLLLISSVAAATALQTLAQRIGLMSILGITLINGMGMSISDGSDCDGSVGRVLRH